MEPANNKSAFKLRSGNKPSIAQMAGVSPMKQDKKFKATFTEEKKKVEKKGVGKDLPLTNFPKHAEKPIGDYKKFDPKHIKTLPAKPGGNLKENIKYLKPL